MISKNLYINIIFYVLLIVITSFTTGYFYFGQKNIYLALMLIVAILIEVSIFIKYLNKTNRRLAYFVDSIKNSDTSVQFPNDIKNKPVRDLYNGLNQLNQAIQKIKIESSYNENLFKTLIEYSSTGFITIDEKGNFNVMNNNARKYLNVEYTSNYKRLSQTDPQLYKIINDLKPGDTKIYKLNLNKQIFDLSISLSEIKYYGKSFKLVSLQDISKELDEQELEAWHKLFRVITHEIMNSIAPITSLTGTLTNLFTHNGEIKPLVEITEKTINDTIKGLKVINDMGNGLVNFVQAYRKLSKIPTPKIQPVDTKIWLSGFKTLALEQIKGENINLVIKLADNCKTISIDEKLINQVMLNFVNNSIDALKNKQEKSINIHVHKNEKNKTIIEFSDNGKGIAEEDFDKIFVPFYTTKEEGTGIGLSLSKQIIKLHNGSIHVNSVLNEKTVFTICI